MLPGIVVDPSLIWLFSEQEDSSTDVERILRDSLLWHSPGEAAGYKLLVVSRAVEELTTLGYFPAEPHVRAVLSSLGLSHVISARQLARDIARFLANLQSIEDESGLKDVLCDRVDIEPDIFQGITHDQLLNLSKACMYFTACVSAISELGPFSYRYAFCRSDGVSRVVQVTGVPLLAEPARLVDELNVGWPFDVWVVAAPQQLTETMSAQDTWRFARSAGDLEVAIRLEAGLVAAAAGQVALRRFVVGQQFLASLEACQASGGARFAPLVLRKCAMIVADAPNVDVQNLRVLPASDSAVRCRESDGALARRVHITKSHEALRLMFWEHGDGTLEFANVADKFDITISE